MAGDWLVTIESMEPGDRVFGLDSWLRSQRDSPIYDWVPNGVYYPRIADRIEQLLATSTVLVARPTSHVSEDGSKDIAGWICGERDPLAPPAPACAIPMVHWLYTKQPYRAPELHVALTLLRALGWADGMPICCTSWNEACEAVAPGTLIFLPSRLGARRTSVNPKAA